MAIGAAWRWIASNKKSEGRSCKILSDSQAAISALLSYTVISQIVREVKELTKKLKEKRRLEIAWVRGHSGSTDNELVDCLAKQSTPA